MSLGITFGLLRSRRFLPLFAVQFLGSLNDNLLRSGLATLIAFKVQDSSGPSPELLVALCAALLIVPFAVFSFLAGQVADKYERARLIRIIKLAECGIMVLACLGFAFHAVYGLMALLFLSGMHSAFFGPLKYCLLPEWLREHELVPGNGLIAGGTYVSILLGMIGGAELALLPGNVLGVMLAGVAAAGMVASLFLQPAPAPAPGLVLAFHPIRETMRLVGHAAQNAALLAAIMGISWFLLVGSVLMAQFPTYVARVLEAEVQVYTLLLTVFSAGVAAGALSCPYFAGKNGPMKLLLPAGIAIGIGLIAFYLATPAPRHEEMLLTLSEFLSIPSSWGMMASLTLIAIAGGVYLVPLYAQLQTASEPEHRARAVAASNVVDSLGMTLAAIASVALIACGVGIPVIFLLLGIATLPVAWGIYRFNRASCGQQTAI